MGWLVPYIHGPCKLEVIPVPRLSAMKAALRLVAPIRFTWQRLHAAMARVPISDGYVESNQFDVVHFPTQAAYLTNLPTIYQPWDLQHLHYPQFFSKAEFILREKRYRAFCGQASFVCVQTNWTKQDVIQQYGIAEDNIVVVPWGSVLDAYQDPTVEEIRATTETYALPSEFFFYPAVTWPHKNHEAILRALQILKRERGIVPHVVFTGTSTGYRSSLDQLSREFGISEQLHFLGFVTPKELQAIFRTAIAMIFPSKFEGFGLPILEAFHAQLPVLCSNATTLPEVARDGARYFDPDSPTELSALMWEILESPELREQMIQKGNQVLTGFSIKDTAGQFQALYARTAALSLENNRLTLASVVNR